mmetsp:Transcript_66147/g.109914  ORF Transcript_66147/g.109914 Transcript_66147/m.109914 type:complete len:245 (-) Transcript_66147:238-972(-)
MECAGTLPFARSSSSCSAPRCLSSAPSTFARLNGNWLVRSTPWIEIKTIRRVRSPTAFISRPIALASTPPLPHAASLNTTSASASATLFFRYVGVNGRNSCTSMVSPSSRVVVPPAMSARSCQSVLASRAASNCAPKAVDAPATTTRAPVPSAALMEPSISRGKESATAAGPAAAFCCSSSSTCASILACIDSCRPHSSPESRASIVPCTSPNCLSSSSSTACISPCWFSINPSSRRMSLSRRS